MGKYNDQENDKYLLENNLLGVKTIEELEEAEAFAFSLRAAELKLTENAIDSFTEEHFKKLHYHLFQEYLSVCRSIPKCSINERKYPFLSSSIY